MASELSEMGASYRGEIAELERQLAELREESAAQGQVIVDRQLKLDALRAAADPLAACLLAAEEELGRSVQDHSTIAVSAGDLRRLRDARGD